MCKRPRRALMFTVRFLAVLIFFSGVILLYYAVRYPHETAARFNDTKAQVNHAVSGVRGAVTGELPVVQYYTDGGLRELHRAPYGGFVRMTAYSKVVGLPETWAIHNGLGGDLIIPWEPGQHFRVTGGGLDGEWVVVDIKSVPRNSTADKILPIKGDLVLHTCFYIGSENIKLVGAVRVQDAEAGKVYENVLGKTREQVIGDTEAKNTDSTQSSPPPVLASE